MVLRRALLVIFGVAGSLLAVLGLYTSAEGAFAMPPTEPIQTQTFLVEEITLPIAVPGTSLIAQRLSGYEGPFMEDGSDREVVDIAALHIYNSGSRAIQKAYIVLFYDERSYVFYGEHIPAGATVLLLERNAAAYRRGSFTACVGWQEVSQQEDRQAQLHITDRAMGTVVVTNRTQKTLKNVRLYYKAWLSPPDIYVGGITYMIEVPLLLPGQTVNLYPHHYASGYSKVVFITTS